MARKTPAKELQEIIDIMNESELVYLELQHPRLGLVKLSKTKQVDVDADADVEETGSITDLTDNGDFKLTDDDFLFASV